MKEVIKEIIDECKKATDSQLDLILKMLQLLNEQNK